MSSDSKASKLLERMRGKQSGAGKAPGKAPAGQLHRKGRRREQRNWRRTGRALRLAIILFVDAGKHLDARCH